MAHISIVAWSYLDTPTSKKGAANADDGIRAPMIDRWVAGLKHASHIRQAQWHAPLFDRQIAATQHTLCNVQPNFPNPSNVVHAVVNCTGLPDVWNLRAAMTHAADTTRRGPIVTEAQPF